MPASVEMAHAPPLARGLDGADALGIFFPEIQSALEDLASPAGSLSPARGRGTRLAPALAALAGSLLTALAFYLFLHQPAETAGARPRASSGARGAAFSPGGIVKVEVSVSGKPLRCTMSAYRR